MFSSHFPPVIGPVRSAREDDLELLAQFGRPAFAYSGAQPELLPVVEKARIGRWLVWMDGAPARATEGGQLSAPTVVVRGVPAQNHQVGARSVCLTVIMVVRRPRRQGQIVPPWSVRQKNIRHSRRTDQGPRQAGRMICCRGP